MKRIYRERRAAGLCVTCGDAASAGMARCDECRSANARKTLAVRARYLADGLCMTCGCQKERKDRQKCRACAADHAWKQKVRQAKAESGKRKNDESVRIDR